MTSNSVEDIYLAKDDGKGKAGETSENFMTTDVPIHCVVLLNTETTATVKMVFVAVSVKNVRPESKVVTVSYKTDGKQNQVNFTGKPDGLWTAGTYRVDIYLDGKAVGNRVFEIEQSLVKTEKSEPSVIKSFARRKIQRSRNPSAVPPKIKFNVNLLIITTKEIAAKRRKNHKIKAKGFSLFASFAPFRGDFFGFKNDAELKSARLSNDFTFDLSVKRAKSSCFALGISIADTIENTTEEIFNG